MAAQKSNVGFGGWCFLASKFQGFLVSLELVFNLGPAPLGFAITGTYADGPAQGFKRQTAFPNGFHDRASGHTPANTHLFEVVDHLFLSIQPNFPFNREEF